MIPFPGRIVQYTLTQDDADQINRRRRDAENNEAIGNTGFVLHVGNPVSARDTFPMMITRAWLERDGMPVNGQVILDGNDGLWVVRAIQGELEGQYCQFPRVK